MQLKTEGHIRHEYFIPDGTEHAAQRENHASLGSRIVVDNIYCLHFLKEHAIWHIKHLYWMTKPTKTVISSLVYNLFILHC